MEKMKRPTSVTVFAWLFIAAGCISFLSIPAAAILREYQQLLETMDISSTAALISCAVSGCIFVVSGIALFKGLHWGRLMYFVLTPFTSWLFFSFRSTSIISLVFYLVVLYYLTKPPASKFFGSDASV